MANELTGDFDLVAEFSLPAANRFLAAMHRFKRFPHSLSMKVDDPPVPDHRGPTVFEVVDAFGDSVLDPGRIIRHPAATSNLATTVLTANLGGLVNLSIGELFIPPIEPSHLQGRAQLQLSPPTLEIADSAATKVRITLQIRSRYFPDPQTPPAAEYALGTLTLTASVRQIASQVGSVIDIDLRGQGVQVSYVPAFSSRQLSVQDLAGINLLIRNALASGFLPSNTSLPPSVQSMKLKAVSNNGQALAILLNTTSAPGDPASMQRVFIGSDDFAFAAAANFIRAALQPAIDELLATDIPPFSFSINLLLGSVRVTYTIKLNAATVALETGRILLTVTGRATTPSAIAPNFNFTVKQVIGLQPDGATVDLVMGELSIDTSSWIADRFRGGGISAMTAARDRALSQAGVRTKIRRMLSADENLGGFLRSLLKPARGEAPTPANAFALRYTSIEITPAGLILRGSLSVLTFPPPQLEFAEVPASAAPISVGVFGGEPTHTAFKSWIPGGTITRFEWRKAGQADQTVIDANRFIRLQPPPVLTTGDATSSGSVTSHFVTGFAPLCLTVAGTRLTASGPVVSQPVGGSLCAFNTFPLFETTATTFEAGLPLVTLTRPGRDGLTEVVGHAPAGLEARGASTPNVIMHFGDASSADTLGRLTVALQESRRSDAATAIVAVFAESEIGRVPHVPGVVYAEDQDGVWERGLRITVSRRPATFVIAPTGTVVWEHIGAIDPYVAAEAFRKVLRRTGQVTTRTLLPSVRISHAPPNFIFEHAPGHQVTLSKLTNRPVIMVFWRSTSRASMEVLRALARGGAGKTWQGATVLAVNDGEPVDLAVKVAAGQRLPGTLVTDPVRSIAKGYGVAAWPTVVFVDADGLVRMVRHDANVAHDDADVSGNGTKASADSESPS